MTRKDVLNIVEYIVTDHLDNNRVVAVKMDGFN